MKLLPRSFFGRNVLLLMALFAFGLGCGALALREWAQKPRITELAELIARQMQLTQLNLEVVPEEQRASMRPWLNARSGIQVLPLETAGPPAMSRYPGPAARQFIDDLRWRLPGEVDVRWVPAERGTVWVRMPVGKSRYWFVEKGIYLEPSVSATGVGILVLVALLSVFGAVRIQRWINRPLTRLVEAARTLESHKQIAPLEENGPQEFAVVSRAFNHMSASLAKADAERVVLLAGVSHDLRTPLAKMRLAIEMLRGNSDADLVQSMLRSVAEMEAVTEQFLYYARDEDRGEFLETELNELVFQSVERQRMGSRTIAFDPGVECFVAVHRKSVGRAVDNLIENAVRYSEGDVDVTVSRGEGHARISVLDRGPGIPPAEIETLKMPFARGSASVGKAGAGLGLAIVERIAVAHGARFDLLPREGGGTEARLELPLCAPGTSVDKALAPSISDAAGIVHAQ